MMNTPKEDREKIGKKFKEIRLAQNLKRETLALRAGVSESSLKRFELSGEVSLESFIKISNVLNVRSWIQSVFEEEHFTSLDEIMNARKKTKKRGTI